MTRRSRKAEQEAVALKAEQEANLKKLMGWQYRQITQKLEEIQEILDRTEAEARVITRTAREGR